MVSRACGPILLTVNFPPVDGGVSRYYGEVVRLLPEISVPGWIEGPSLPQSRLRSVLRMKELFWAYRVTRHTDGDTPVLAGQLHLALGVLFAGHRPIVFLHGGEWNGVRALRLLRPLIMLASRHLIANSKATKERWVPRFLHSKVAVVRPGLSTFAEMELRSRRVLRRNPGAMRVICVSRLSPRKGIDRLIRSVGICLEKGIPIELDIVGTGSEHRRLTQLARPYPSVQLHGFLDDHQVAALLRSASLFALLPSEIAGSEVWEGFGIVFLEAAAFGLPVVGTRTGGVSEAVCQQGSILIDERATDSEVADLLESLYSSPERLRTMAAVNLAWAQSQTWESRTTVLRRILAA